MSPAPMLIVFEGIDGSGKTTISNRVAERLREQGVTVTHVRSNGRLASDVAESIRQFTRDQRNLALDPFAELLLYTAREAQQLQECVKPALAAGHVVIADRFLHTPEVLARFGRGVPMERIAPIIEAARDGVEPALTILIDVDPYIARVRRRADKIARPISRTSSRKGLAGAGLMTRLRDGYRQLAAANDNWIVVDNTDADLDALVGDLANAILARRTGGGLRTSAHPQRTNRAITISEARDAFFAAVDARAPREPEVAAYLLGQLPGTEAAARRSALASRAPAIIASGLRDVDDDAAWALRARLAGDAPYEVARSLITHLERDTGTSSIRAWCLRAELARSSPAGVAESLTGLSSNRAWSMRDELWTFAPDAVVHSLAGDSSQRATDVRDRWLQRLGGERRLREPEIAAVLAHSLRGLSNEHAWHLRDLARAGSPVGVLLSLEGVSDERSWQLRERALARAPRPVLRTIAGSDDPRAWELRDRVALTSKEVLDSIAGLDDERAWDLRERTLDMYPSTVVKSLGALATSARGAGVIRRQLANHAHDLSLLRHLVALGVDPAIRKAVA
jgi:dTMP kinase